MQWVNDTDCWKLVLFLSVFSTAVFLSGLGQERKLRSREIRHISMMKDMASTGNYLIPRNVCRMYPDKPPVIHAPAAILMNVFGSKSAFLARFPAALAAVASVLFLFGIGGILLNQLAGLLSALLLISLPGFGLFARTARPDMILVACVLAGCFFFALSFREPVSDSYQNVLYFGAGVFTGLGTITKGPVALVVPVLFALLVPFMDDSVELGGTSWLFFAVGLFVIPGIWIQLLSYQEHGLQYLNKVLFQPDVNPVTGDEAYDFTYYIRNELFLLFPAWFFLPWMIRRIYSKGIDAYILVFLVFFVILTLVPKKRKHYLLPAFPMFCLSAALSLRHYYEKSRGLRGLFFVFVPFGIFGLPLFYLGIQPSMYPKKDPNLRMAEYVNENARKNIVYAKDSELQESLVYAGFPPEQITTETSLRKTQDCFDPSKPSTGKDTAEEERTLSPSTYVMIHKDEVEDLPASIRKQMDQPVKTIQGEPELFGVKVGDSYHLNVYRIGSE